MSRMPTGPGHAVEQEPRVGYAATTRVPALDKTTLLVGGLAATLLFLYGPVLWGLVRSWVQHDRWEGFLIPVISGYLIWTQRESLGMLPRRVGLSLGLPIVLLGGGLLLLGRVAGVASLEEVSLIVMIFGLAGLFLGGSILRALVLPLSYLFLMLSIVPDLLDPLHWPFQLLTAEMAVRLLQGLGFVALVEHQYIQLPHTTLEVAEVCSGVKFLLAIAAVGVPLAHLTLRHWWNRALLVISALGIGIATNWLRVALIGAWVSAGGDVLHGPMHVLQGMSVAWVGYLVLFAGAWGLSRLEPQPSTPQPASRPASVHPGMAPSKPDRRPLAAGLALLVTVTITGYLVQYEAKATPIGNALQDFPRRVDGWIATRGNPADALIRVPGADAELYLEFHHREHRALNLYIAYLERQHQGKEIVNPTTIELHKLASQSRIPIDGRSMDVNRVRLGPSHGRQTVYYWYRIGGRDLHDPVRAKLAGMAEALLRGRSAGALIVLESPDGDGPVGERRTQEEAFLAALQRDVHLRLP